MNRLQERKLRTEPAQSTFQKLESSHRLPAGIKIHDLLSGKYKPKSGKKLIHFKDASREQREPFHAKNLPQRCLQNYHSMAHPAGMVLNEFAQLRNFTIKVHLIFICSYKIEFQHEAFKPKISNFGHRIVIKGMVFAEAEGKLRFKSYTNPFSSIEQS